MKRVFGGILMAAGILIAGLSGLCSIVVGGSMMTDSSGLFSGSGLLGLLPMILLFGGIPFVLGVGVFIGGRALVREADRQAASDAEKPTGGHGEPGES
jgi:hypothetical protein